jgi:hypothetical protein
VGETSTAWPRLGGPGGRTENTPPSFRREGNKNTWQVSRQPVTRAAEAPHPALPRSEKPGPFLSHPRPQERPFRFSLSLAGFACAGSAIRIARALPLCRDLSAPVPQKAISSAASCWFPALCRTAAAPTGAVPSLMPGKSAGWGLTNHLFLFEYMKRQ